MSGNQEPILVVGECSVARGGWRVGLAPFTLAGGDALALLGPSGCGKSTLLEALLGLPSAAPVQRQGDIRFRGEAWPPVSTQRLREVLRHEVLYLPQNAHAALDPLTRVGAQVARFGGGSSEAVPSAFAALGVPGLVSRFPHELSGGEAQRVLLALALVRRPRLLVADEPTANLDRATARVVVARLRTLCDEAGTALWFATHDVALVRELGARSFVARRGRFEAGTPEARVFPRAPQPPTDAPLRLVARGVEVARGRRSVLRGAELELRAGECVALLGPSGAGKSTFARVLAGLEEPTRGRVERPSRRAAVQMLFQEARASLTPARPLRSLLAEVAPGPGWTADTAKELGLGLDLLERPREALSGGELRRAALLRALAVRPEVLLLDEPTASLDPASALALIELVVGLQVRHGVAILLITHDEDLARATAHRIVRLEEGTTCSQAIR